MVALPLQPAVHAARTVKLPPAGVGRSSTFHEEPSADTVAGTVYGAPPPLTVTVIALPAAALVLPTTP